MRCSRSGRAKRSRCSPTVSAGVSEAWSGQFEYLERARARLAVVLPFTLLMIFVPLYLAFRRFDEAALIMATLLSMLVIPAACYLMKRRALVREKS